MDFLIDLFANTQAVLYERVMQPMAFAMGLGSRLEDVFNATGWLLVGLLQLAVMLAVIGPLQRWRPVEPVTDRAAIRTDVIYTVIHRFGVFRCVLFFTLDPWVDDRLGEMRAAGFGTFHLEDIWPGVTDAPLLSMRHDTRATYLRPGPSTAPSMVLSSTSRICAIAFGRTFQGSTTLPAASTMRPLAACS